MKLFERIFSLIRKRNKRMAKKFDIMIYDVDDEGHQTPPERVTGVMAENAKSLVSMYKACGQTIKIEREYTDSESDNYGKMNIDDTTFNPSSGSLGSGGGLMTSSALTPEMKKALADTQEAINNGKTATVNTQAVNTATQNVQTQVKDSPPVIAQPKFFNVGGVMCKYENGKMYQKQWMKLTDKEASEFRIVADKSNKICPLKDKHVEVLKWVMIDDDSNNSEPTGGLILG